MEAPLFRTSSFLSATLALLWLAAAPADAAAATKKAPAKQAATKKTSSVKKKTAAKKTTVKKVVTTPKKKTKAKAPKKAVVVVPKRPPADLPPITEVASAWQGCLQRSDVPMLAVQLGIEEYRLNTLLEDIRVPGDQSGACTPYVAATGGLDNAALAMFPTNPASIIESPVLVVRKTPEGISVNQDTCDCHSASSRILTFPLVAAGKLDAEALAQLPANILWIAQTLVPSMTAGLLHDDESETPATTADYNLRLVITDPTEAQPEHLHSIEIIEASTGTRVDGAWWLERPDGPGVLIGMNGLSYEQLLWQSPVAYEHKSRGVGPRYTTVKRKAKDGTITTRRVLSSRTYHYGVDMMAKKGTEIHAVADAKVAFVGRATGFGNLIILDHGHGYTTYYAHLSKFMPETKLGATIPRGQLIGLVGSTGRSTAPHLHFEMRQNNNYIDPLDGTHQLDFWLLTPADQELLAKQILAPIPTNPIVAAAFE